MFKFLLALPLLLASLGCLSIDGIITNDLTVSRVEPSIVRLTSLAIGEVADTRHYCTGFHVSETKILTAAHCVDGAQLKAAGEDATLLKKNVYFDLALIETPVKRPPLTIRHEPTQRFEALIGIGYGYGWSKTIALRRSVINPHHAIMPEVPEGLVVQGTYITGMSGGPVIDINGDVVGVIQMSNDKIGYGVGSLIIEIFLYGEL